MSTRPAFASRVLELKACIATPSFKILLHMSVLVYVGACRGRKWVIDSLELELQTAVSYQTWVLGAQFGSSRETATLLKLSHFFCFYTTHPLKHINLSVKLLKLN